MGKTGKWIRSFLTGKKDKYNSNQIVGIIPENKPAGPKEKKRWSFWRSSAGHKDPNSVVEVVTPPRINCSAAETRAMLNHENGQNYVVVVVNEEAASAAVKIQSVFRSYLARKALSALKGITKLQALVRGHIVRKQATATLRCMPALVTVQVRALAQRIRMAEEAKSSNHRPPSHRKSTTHDNNMWNSYHDNNRGSEDDIKIVEMDLGVSKGGAKTRKSYSNIPQADLSPRVRSVHGDYSFATAQSSPQYYSAMSQTDPSRVLPFAYHRPDYVYPFSPSYMAYTESSRAKVRSQSAPKQHLDSFEKQPRSMRNIPRAVKMQRSFSHQYPWSDKLNKSSVSIKESECGSSTSTLFTNINYCKSLVSYDPQAKRY